MGRDQNDTAVRVAHVGAGVRVPPKASSDRIAAAVSEVLENTSYAEAASRMATAIEHEQASLDVVAEIEALVNDAATRPSL